MLFKVFSQRLAFAALPPHRAVLDRHDVSSNGNPSGTRVRPVDSTPSHPWPLRRVRCTVITGAILDSERVKPHMRRERSTGPGADGTWPQDKAPTRAQQQQGRPFLTSLPSPLPPSDRARRRTTTATTTAGPPQAISRRGKTGIMCVDASRWRTCNTPPGPPALAEQPLGNTNR